MVLLARWVFEPYLFQFTGFQAYVAGLFIADMFEWGQIVRGAKFHHLANFDTDVTGAPKRGFERNGHIVPIFMLLCPINRDQAGQSTRKT